MFDELTGLEEHLHFMASEECGELAFMRREAEREWRLEADMAAAEAEDERLEFERRQADPLTSICLFLEAPECRFRADDDIPF